MKLHILAGLLMGSLSASQGSQINGIAVSTSVSKTATQAILQYSSPVDQACSLKAADMNRGVVVTGGSQAGEVVTITTRAPHGLSAGAVVYLEGTGVAGWDGWQTVSAVTDTSHFSFGSANVGATTAGNAGVLVDDLNPVLFPGADQDSRPGNPNSGRRRVFVIGKRTADLAIDGNRYTRALQVNSRHHYTLTCGDESYSGDFSTLNLPVGDTHNEGLPTDRSNPGQYAYPTVQWTNRGQSLIDPITGIRSARATGPGGAASTMQSFQTGIDSDAVWTTPPGPLSSGGKATFTGPCQSGTCWLFLRADDLSLGGGATYTSGYGVGSSLDWVAVTISNASVNRSSCTGPNGGDDCKIVACLSVNGVSCSSSERSVALTSSPATYTVGSKTTIDLWQDSGTPGIARPDVSKATGTVNYSSSTRQLTWVSGNKFSVKWTPGSRIMVAGSEYRIESIQSELSLTLAAPGPVGNLQQDPYSANNFGVLIRKKTATADQVTIGYTTFQYGSTGHPSWPSESLQSCSSAVVTVNGVAGYNCFLSQELFWMAADGSDVHDLGWISLPGKRDSNSQFMWNGSAGCGQNGLPNFDPLDGDTWYCMVNVYPFNDPRLAVLKVHYEGPHTTTMTGAASPDCDVTGQPCIRITMMQPNKADAVAYAGPSFSTEYRASGYAATYWVWGGVSPDGDIQIYAREAGGQDTKGWIFIFTLGDRTPTGTGPNSMRMVAAASSYRHAPGSWCTIHADGPPDGNGWMFLSHNDFSVKSGNYVYRMTLTSTPLNTNTGVAGGLNACPSNLFRVTGQNCTDIVTAGEPVNVGDGSYLQDTQVGDVIRVDNEFMRVLVKADSKHLTVQRGFAGNLASHAGTSLPMFCGLVNGVVWMPVGVWNYRADPYGLNANWDTLMTDWNNVGGHGAGGGGAFVQSVGSPSRIGEAACPSALLGGNGANCYQVRRGTISSVLTQPSSGVALNPPFGSALGIGTPNTVDSHPGPCLGQWCLDGRPMDGGSYDGVAYTLGSSSTPFVNVTGQLWKLAGGAATLKLKTLATMAYVGRSPLVDISGPASSLASDPSAAYRYCVALKVGECRGGSAVNDVYVNAPYVSYGYCYYPGIAVQGDDVNSICIGPLGAYAGGAVQFGTRQDATGSYIRRLGPMFSRWGQQSVFWNMSMLPSGTVGLSQVRWLDGVRHENLLTILPPYPESDSTSRNTFVPIKVKILPVLGTTGRNIVVEFGYAENGGSSSFFCTSRQETCVAASGAVDQTSPFHFAQTETYSGIPCDSGCTVTIPALSQRVLYYRWKQRDASGTVVAVSDTRATVTP